jgi:hypothetical protein
MGDRVHEGDRSDKLPVYSAPSQTLFAVALKSRFVGDKMFTLEKNYEGSERE